MSRTSRPWRNSAAPNRAGEAFLCGHCGRTVPGEAPGTSQRNHCPHCLRSRHVDVVVGDRRSLCAGIMDPISLWLRQGGEVALLHRCRRCGVIRSNRLAGDDDRTALRALAQPLSAAGEDSQDQLR
jgi:hypothetical protein